MLKGKLFGWSVEGFVFAVLLGAGLLAGVGAADINDQVALVDFETATIDDVIDIFGEPISYLWGSITYTRDNLPAYYLARYANGFDVVMGSGHIVELRFNSVASGYVWAGGLVVGSSLEDVLEIVGEPTETVVGQATGWEDGVLYKDINGIMGYCYYRRPDWNIRFFFSGYNVNALYMMGPAPIVVNEFDDVRSEDLSESDLSGKVGIVSTLTFNEETEWPVSEKMPAGEDPHMVMIGGMNPGLGVRGLHLEGVTGAGVNVGIIDQPMYVDHAEYAGKVAGYFDTGCGGSERSMHGPAVMSLLAGVNCGTAPGVRVYYAAAPSWLADAAYFAAGLDWIIAQNEAASG